MLCACCSTDVGTGKRGTHATHKLCPSCRADPANAGWLESDPFVDLASDLDRALSHDPQERPIGLTPQRPLRIDTRVIILLKSHGLPARLPRVDRWGRARGVRISRLPISDRTVAELLRCSKTLVWKIRARVMF